MKISGFLFLMICLLDSVGASQGTDAEGRGLRGRVKLQVQHETYFCCTPNARRRGPRLLNGTATFNKKGAYLEWISINNTSDGPHYERRVFRYGANGRKTGAEVYKSDRNPAETYFELAKVADGRVTLKPEVAEKLAERISYLHDSDGRLIEEVSRDPNENLILRRVFSYDRDGRMIRATVLKDGGVIDNESITVYLDGGRRSESTGIRPGSDVFRSVTYYDPGGRAISGDQYSLKADADGRTSRYVLQNRSKYIYVNGREKQLDWKFYKEDGSPSSKIVIVWDDHGEDLSRDEFNAGPLPVGSRNEDIEPEWILRERSLYRRVYDGKGNLISSETRQQCGIDAPLELTNIYEYSIEYY